MEKNSAAFDHWLKKQFPQLPLAGVKEALRLLNEGMPAPYIAYFYKDSTEQLKLVDLNKILNAKEEWNEISRRQSYILREIEAQGKLLPETKEAIERTFDLDRLEDFYAPFKLKKQTLAVQARDAGLEPLAIYIWNKGHGIETEEVPGATLVEKATAFAKPDTKFTDADTVCKGVQDILVEKIAENSELRSLVRSAVLRRSKLKCSKGPKAKANSKFTKFFDYQEPVGALKKNNAAHRYLLIRKGWMEDELSVSFERPDEGVLLEKFEEYACSVKDSIGAELLLNAARLALKGNVYTVMENETHRYLKESAELSITEHLVEVLTKKLLRPAFGAKAVMGVDPGTPNTPINVVVLDSQGKYLVHSAFKSEDFTDAVKAETLKTIENLKIEAIALAHGPRSKEVREFWQKLLSDAGLHIPVIGIHEHSSSIYASSGIAKEEFPDLDVNTRRAIFVARFLQDPLSALLRLDVKYLSLGEFQHDISPQTLRRELQRAMEASVNFVGVDVNTAPLHLLSRVSGVDMDLAKAIIARREKTPFTSRKDLLQVEGFTDKHFEHAAAFLRIRNGTEWLDATAIHPKHYAAIKDFAQTNGVSLESFTDEVEQKLLADENLKKEIGETNLKNIAYELRHHGEDPRGNYDIFTYNTEAKTASDLKKDIPYRGIVTNITSFGAFVDVGVEQDGLVHISEIKDVNELFPGDPIQVWLLQVNEEKKQISFTVKDPAARAPRAPRRPRVAPQGAQAGGAPRGERPQYRRPRRDQQAPGPEGQAAAGAPNGAPSGERGEGRPPREGGRRFNNRDRGGPGSDKERQPPKDDRAKKKPQRDPKTGAIVKLDEFSGRGSREPGPRVASKAKPHTFNPFANLGNLLKDKIAKEE